MFKFIGNFIGWILFGWLWLTMMLVRALKAK